MNLITLTMPMGTIMTLRTSWTTIALMKTLSMTLYNTEEEEEGGVVEEEW